MFLVVAGIGISCRETPAQLLLTVDSDRPLTSVEATVGRIDAKNQNRRQTHMFMRRNDSFLPFSFGVAPPKGAFPQRVRVDIVGREEVENPLYQRLIFPVTEGLVGRFTIRLSSSCRTVACRNDQTCAEGQCRSQQVAIDELTGGRPNVDAGMPWNPDAGPDTGGDPADPPPPPEPPTLEVSGGTFTDHGMFGNSMGGSGFEDVCPAGSGLVGFSLNVMRVIDRIAGVCSEMELHIDDTVIPKKYSILAGTTTTMPSRGLNRNQGTQVDIRCPRHAFVIGISGEATTNLGVHDVNIDCAPLEVSEVSTTTQSEFIVRYGMVTTHKADGELVGEVYVDTLSAPAFVDRYRGRSGAWVDAIGIGESIVEFTPR